MKLLYVAALYALLSKPVAAHIPDYHTGITHTPTHLTTITYTACLIHDS